MRLDSINSKYAFLILFIISLVLCLINSWGYPVFILDEAKNTEAAREMLLNQQYFFPKFNGEIRTDKPPLHYFFMILGFKIFGINAFGARFFSGVLGAIIFSSSFYYVRKFTDYKLAIFTWAILVSSVLWVHEFHLAVPDPYLIASIVLAFFCFYDYFINGGKIKLFFFYFFLGLGVLAKGPVAVALPGLSIAVFIFSQRNFKWQEVFKYYPISGLVFVVLIALPWYYNADLITHGEFTQGFFFKHNFQRFGKGMEGHGGLFVITWAFILLGLFPMSFFLIQSLFKAWKNKRNHDFVWFCECNAIVFITFFSISGTKLPNYPMPCYPFLAFLIANYICALPWDKLKSKRYFLIGFWAIIVVSFLAPVGGFLALKFGEPQLGNSSHYAWLLLLVSLGAIVAIRLIKQKKYLSSIRVIMVSWFVMSFVFYAIIYPKITQYTPAIARKSDLKSEKDIVVYQRFDPSLPFNFKKIYPIYNDQESLLEGMKENQTNLFLTTNKALRDSALKMPVDTVFQQKILFENSTLFLFRLKTID